MIVEGIENIITLILGAILDIIPDLPDLPQNLQTTLMNFIDLIFTYGGNFLGLFVRISTLKVILPFSMRVSSTSYERDSVTPSF